MSEKGTVKHISNGIATIKIEENSGCSSCRMCKREQGAMLLEANAPEGLQPGQTVVLKNTGSTWAASFLLFFVPLVGMILGIILGQFFQPLDLLPDAASAMLGFGFFAISFAVALLWEKRLKNKPERKAQIITFYQE